MCDMHLTVRDSGKLIKKREHPEKELVELYALL